MEDIKELLHKIRRFIDEDEFLKKEKSKRGEDFNVFKIMHVENDEVRTHSAMLAALMDPKGTHSCGTVFLELFCQQLQNFVCDSKYSNFVFDSTNATVNIEKSIGGISRDKEEGGRMDILIESGNVQGDKTKAIIIENKIYASDQTKQLYRYYQFAEQKYGLENSLILYLTLDGHSPHDISVTGSSRKMKKNEDYFCISYRDFIRPWLQKCTEKAFDKPLVRETIIQYRNLLSLLTYQNMDEQKQKELIELLANSENIFTAIRIHDNYNRILNKVIGVELRKQVEEIVNELRLELEFRTEDGYWQQQYSHFLLWKKEWNYVKICFEFKNANFNKLSYGIRYNSPKTREDNENIKQRIQEKTHDGRSEEWWAYIKDFEYNDWRREYVYRKLFNKDIQKEIKERVQDLMNLTEGITM